ncbi:hypothetical protein AB0P15_03040 [Streptomyces sp. NPDC087917]|uniref:hypothetical protein n=1 Tax=Streptomyces sp. NPDC087917 TaxID=3155060 RepID=UPI00342C48BC
MLKKSVSLTLTGLAALSVAGLPLSSAHADAAPPTLIDRLHSYTSTGTIDGGEEPLSPLNDPLHALTAPGNGLG